MCSSDSFAFDPRKFINSGFIFGGGKLYPVYYEINELYIPTRICSSFILIDIGI